MRSSNFREARRAGEKMTISRGTLRAMTATKMATLAGGAGRTEERTGLGRAAYENVLPKRLGVDISTSENDLSQPFAVRMSGFDSDQSSR
jgi:hypothetical protein